MDLSRKLNMLAGKSGFESDDELSGIIIDNSSQNIVNNDDEEPLDFNLGELSIDSYLRESGYPKKKKNKKNKKEKTYQFIFGDIENSSSQSKDRARVEKIVETTKHLVQSAQLASADDFDNFLDDESAFSAEEDAEMRNNLISLGRKYARDSSASKESSEISKTFADSEKRLKSLYEEIDRDKGSLQKDIDRLRVPGRGGKSLAELISAKNSMQSTQLSVVKEINTLRKNIFEMRQKEAARKDAENAGTNDINANTLQSIFSSSRSGLVNSMGGYSGVSGAQTDSEGCYGMVSDDLDDEEIQRRYFSNNDNPSSLDDGSKFLEYEDRGVEYILLIDSDDKVQGIIAEDKDGVLIPDYPLPNNIEDLNFEIDHTSKMASDNLHRNYHIRIID